MNIVSELEANLAQCDSLFEAEQLILKASMRIAQQAMASFLERLDDQLSAQAQPGCQTINRQSRTINFAFGPVTFKRRYCRCSATECQFHLDQALGIASRSRQSPYYLMMMAKLGQATTMRNAAMALNLIFDNGVTHDTVMRAVHQLGPLVAEETQRQETKPVQRRVPENLTIEGDAFMIKLKKPGKTGACHCEVHHYRVYERVGQEIVRCHDFLETGSLEHLEARVRAYLDRHYQLNGQTVFLASDGGPGYTPERLLNLIPIYAHGAYFLDRYHCLQKIENTMGKNNVLTPLATKAVRKHEWTKVTAALDSYESWNLSAEKTEALKALRAYLKRNWEYIPSPKDRGYDLPKIGSIESSHRAYTYRMKKQGKTWAAKGLAAMISLIEARVDGTLQTGLEASLKQLTSFPAFNEPLAEEVKVSMRTIMKKAPIRPSKGAFTGVLPLDAPTSSPIGRLFKALAH